MKGNPETVSIVEVGSEAGPLPTLKYRYLTDRHYAVSVTSGQDSWRIELSLQKLPKPILKTSEATLFAEHVEEPRVFVAKAQGRAVAWIELGLQKWNNRMRVWQLLVEEDYRRKGIGTQLIGHAIEEAKKSGARMLVLETQSCNLPAIAFYLKHGFQLVGFDSAAYGNENVEKGEVRLEFGQEL